MTTRSRKLADREALVVSTRKLILNSALAAGSVLFFSFLIQWLIYEHWLHRTGPLRVVGTLMATVITFAFVLRWQYSLREQQRQMIRRLQKILDMNDRIRNALQAIECVTYLSRPEATESVRQSVKAIDLVLGEVLEDTNSPSAPGIEPGKAAASISRRSA